MNKPVKEEVTITLTSLIEDLENGLTWLKVHDAGYGSIQEKYKARDRDILAIKEHPKLQGIEPHLRIYLIKDDLDGTTQSPDHGTATTGSLDTATSQDNPSGRPVGTDTLADGSPEVDLHHGGTVPGLPEAEPEETEATSLSKFINHV